MTKLSRLRNPVLCVDIGGTSTKAGVLTEKGDLVLTNEIPTRPTQESYFSNLCELIAQTRAAARTSLDTNPRQLGLAMAGFLDPNREHLVYNSNLAWLEGFPLRERLCEIFPDLSVELEVDSNAATMAEYQLGSGQGSQRFLCITAGTGLGVGMAIDGSPVRFAYGCLGDIGHIIVQPNGPLCTCGGRGCAEIMVSAPVLAQHYKSITNRSKETTLRTVIEEAGEGDESAISILAKAGESLGIAIASMANIFFPDHIAIAGGLSAAGPLVLEPAECAFRESASVFARSSVTFTQAKLGAAATIIGAAWPYWDEKEL
ncbi:MAG TPA: ROK family protein [Bryobacteraceae bacterium]|jgi:glucokinase|nr:ROK family protein [Bryobacteraceae bacterium]